MRSRVSGRVSGTYVATDLECDAARLVEKEQKA
jgi:hypothetical protein